MYVSLYPAPLLRSRLVLLAAIVLCLCGLAPSRTCAQAAGSDYTASLPSVQQVETQLQGTDPIDTAARQVAVFEYLQVYIQRIRDARQYNGPYTPGELQHQTDYAKAQYDLTQSFTKAHTPDEVKTFQQKEGNYSVNNALDWIKQLEGTQAANAYSGAESSLAATQQAHVAQEQQQYQQAQQASQQQTGMVNGQAMPISNDPTSVAIQRCLELGGSTGSCMGGSLIGGMLSLATGGAGMDSLTGPGRAGVVLSGNYGPATGGASVAFSGDSASINNCGKLVPDNVGYTLRKAANSLQVALAGAPSPIMLTMRADGSLSGPGPVSVTGQVITGYQTVTSTQMINGARAAANQCNGPCQTVSQVPVYAAATDRCTLGALAAPPPPPPPSANGSDAAPLGGLLGAITAVLPGGDAAASLPGLRMEGKYGSNGLLLDFAGDAVTLDCGRAHVKSPYTVENAASALIVHVQNPGGPFDLVVSSDNSLRGSGSTTINGKLVSGMNGDDITFTPHSEACQVGSYAPQSGSGATTTVAANASPAPVAAATPASPVTATTTAAPVSAATASTGSMTLAITSSFPIAKNPLGGAIVKLMTDRFDNVLRKAGAPVPAGTTPGQALAAYVQSCPPPTGCPAAAQLMKQYYVGTATFDNNGSATISAAVPPGNYYVICSAQGTSGALVWDMPVALKAGQKNSIVLTATNAELVK